MASNKIEKPYDREVHVRFLEMRLEEMRAAYFEGDLVQLIEAILLCGRHTLPLPSWVVSQFELMIDLWKDRKSKTPLDIPHPAKGTHRECWQQRRELAYEVFHRVCDLHKEDPRKYSIGDPLFERAGKEFKDRLGKPLKKHAVSDYYYSCLAVVKERQQSPAWKFLREYFLRKYLPDNPL